MKLDLKKITNLTFGGITLADYPKFCDAFIESGDYGDRKLTEKELDYLNDTQSEFVNEELHNFLH